MSTTVNHRFLAPFGEYKFEFLFIRVVPSILSKSKVRVLISYIVPVLEWLIQLAWMEGMNLYLELPHNHIC